jgi:hypothetical protein
MLVQSSDLSQMGKSTVKLVELDGKQCIQKSDVSIIESDFYQFISPLLIQCGINIPETYAINGHTLIIEYIPHSISLEDLSHTSETYDQLAILHRSKFDLSATTCQHQWTPKATNQALKHLNLPDVAIDALAHIQKSDHSVFSTQSIISGDTNSGNWGRRNNGELVLFDWERFGSGCPTIDLAPLISGMGSIDTFEITIDRYAKSGLDNLPRDPINNLIVAKSWIAIEVINILVEREKAQKDKYLGWFNTTLPDWLYEMGNAI